LSQPELPAQLPRPVLAERQFLHRPTEPVKQLVLLALPLARPRLDQAPPRSPAARLFH
jgi:hypothetical protein